MQTPPSLRGFRPDAESVADYRERYYDSIPYEFQHLVCDCEPNGRTFKGRQPNGDSWFTFKDGVLKHYCGKYTTLWTYLEICYSCDEMYVVKVCPDRMMLCEGCGG